MSRWKNIALLAAVLAVLAFMGYLIHSYTSMHIERSASPSGEARRPPGDAAVPAEDAEEEAEAVPAGVPEGPVDPVKRERELAAAGRIEEACTLLRSTIRSKKNEPEALLLLGYCMLEAGDPKKAAEAFTRASLLGGGEGEKSGLVIGLAESFRRQGKVKLALEYYGIYTAEHPDGPHARLAEKQAKRLSSFLKTPGLDACERGLCEPAKLPFPIAGN